MDIKKDRTLLRFALAEGIRTAAELAAWLKRRNAPVRAIARGMI